MFILERTLKFNQFQHVMYTTIANFQNPIFYMQTFTHTVKFAILKVCLLQGLENTMNKVSITASF